MAKPDPWQPSPIDNAVCPDCPGVGHVTWSGAKHLRHTFDEAHQVAQNYKKTGNLRGVCHWSEGHGEGLYRVARRHLRDELLDEEIFDTLNDARRKIALWRYDSNAVRPDSSLGNLTSLEAFRALALTEGAAPGALALNPPPTTNLKPANFHYERGTNGGAGYLQAAHIPAVDCLYALQPKIPNLTRSALHRCLQRQEISRLPNAESDKQKWQRSAPLRLAIYISRSQRCRPLMASSKCSLALTERASSRDPTRSKCRQDGRRQVLG